MRESSLAPMPAPSCLQLLTTCDGHLRCITLLGRLRVERRANGDASSVMAVADMGLCRRMWPTVVLASVPNARPSNQQGRGWSAAARVVCRSGAASHGWVSFRGDLRACKCRLPATAYRQGQQLSTVAATRYPKCLLAVATAGRLRPRVRASRFVSRQAWRLRSVAGGSAGRTRSRPRVTNGRRWQVAGRRGHYRGGDQLGVGPCRRDPTADPVRFRALLGGRALLRLPLWAGPGRRRLAAPVGRCT